MQTSMSAYLADRALEFPLNSISLLPESQRADYLVNAQPYLNLP